MRLIDADKITYTHAIARCIEDGHNWNELCVTKDEIDDMPTVNRWMPCDKSMPKHDIDVLVWVYDSVSIARLERDPYLPRTQWRFEEYCLSGDEKSHVKAWMPLPEPYKAE